MQLGFVIDHSRCIGCHACTVACKSENGVPVGDFRTWVKYTETGSFPTVRRDFAVLRCNQCTDAPCITICPVSALEKRPDGIVDIDPAQCIGCKACMHGCPYDALYINDSTGTAEKCHFCAHRTERGLAPACAVVCPTEAIIPGDFDDPESRVSKMRAEFSLEARKPEAGTGPNVLYREVDEAGIDPGLTNLSEGFIWSENPTGDRMDAQLFEAMERRAKASMLAEEGSAKTASVSEQDAVLIAKVRKLEQQARTVYDVPRDQLWGGKITGYLFAKSVAAGAFLAGWVSQLLMDNDEWPPLTSIYAGIGLLFLMITGALLVADLKRPSRFWKILVRPNWSSWLARGTYLIVGYSALLLVWACLPFLPVDPSDGLYLSLGWLTCVLAALTACYTGWLFAQAKGRVLWMKRGYWAHLIVQAFVAGAAMIMAVFGLVGANGSEEMRNTGSVLIVSLFVHYLFVRSEGRMAPARREEEYARAVRLITHGPFYKRHLASVIIGIVIPVALIALSQMFGLYYTSTITGVFALVGLWIEKDTFVRAGQALPIS
jgi:Fe-S-cluster-containing dehydrogenase component/formate-dependent nitrite reductase membrane component NrfD